MPVTYTPPFRMTDRITGLAMEIAELVGRISGPAGLSANPQLRRDTQIRSIYSSLAIEQNTLSLEQVTDVIDGRRVAGPLREIREVQNAYEAYERMGGWDPASKEDLLQAHRTLMEGLIPDAGQYRTGNVGVYSGSRLIHVGTPAQAVPEVMDQLLDWLRASDTPPLIKSCIFHYEFEFIHPFSDGNGRTGRLWQSLILQQWKPVFALLPVESMIHRNQQAYYRALNEANTRGESTGFVLFLLGVLRDALRQAEAGSSDDVGANVGVNVGANAGGSEAAILAALKNDPALTARALAERTGLSARQVERILKRLKEQGKILRHGAAKNGYWEVTDSR